MPYRRLMTVVLAIAPTLCGQAPPSAAIDAAVERGCGALERTQRPDGRFADRVGEHALVVLALLHSGRSPLAPAIARALSPLCDPVEYTYDRAVRLMVIERIRALTLRRGRFMNHQTLARIAAEDARVLVQSQSARGAWWYGVQAGEYDNSNTQYALLGLRAADRMGIEIDAAVWRKALNHVLRELTQDGGAPYRQDRGRTDATPSMTAGALSSVLVAKARCGYREGGTQLKRVDWAIEKMTRYLAREWKPDGGAWSYYTLYGVERGLSLSLEGRLGRRDWYAEGATWLLRRQARDGFWNGPRDLQSTSFALLFLARASLPAGAETPIPLAALMDGLGPQSREGDAAAAIARFTSHGMAIAPLLVPYLSSPEREVRSVAAASLRAITGKRCGYDPAVGPERNVEAIRLWKDVVRRR